MKLYQWMDAKGEFSQLKREIEKELKKTDQTSSQGERVQNLIFDWINRHKEAGEHFMEIFTSNKKLIHGILNRFLEDHPKLKSSDQAALIAQGEDALLRAIADYDFKNASTKFSTCAGTYIRRALTNLVAKEIKIKTTVPLDALFESDPYLRRISKEEEETLALIDEAFSTNILDRREALILRLRYEALNPSSNPTEAEPKKFSDIGIELKISAERARQLEERAVRKLAKFITHKRKLQRKNNPSVRKTLHESIPARSSAIEDASKFERMKPWYTDSVLPGKSSSDILKASLWRDNGSKLFMQAKAAGEKYKKDCEEQELRAEEEARQKALEERNGKPPEASISQEDWNKLTPSEVKVARLAFRRLTWDPKAITKFLMQTSSKSKNANITVTGTNRSLRSIRQKLGLG